MKGKISAGYILIILIVFTLSIEPANAQISAEKFVRDSFNLSVEEPVTVQLWLTNDYEQPIVVEIEDSNIIGNGGINVQCMEETLPKNKTTVIEYDKITPYAPGNFTLAKAKVRYQDPVTGEPKETLSNRLSIEVAGEQLPGTRTESITEIYRCDGMNMQSTSYSTTTTGQSQQNKQQQFQEELQKIQQQMDDKKLSDQISQKMQNRIMNQDSNSLKQSMEKQFQEQQQMQDSLQSRIQNSSDFQQMEQELKNKGYERQAQTIQPESESTGQFEYNYRDENNNIASIKGSMKDGRMKDLKSFTTEDMARQLQNNSDYQDALNELGRKGFSAEDAQFNPETNKFSQNFNNPQTGDTARIEAGYDFYNQTFKNFTQAMQDSIREQSMMNNTASNSTGLNEKLSRLDEKLEQQGFLPQKMQFQKQLNQSFTTFSKKYFNNMTNQTAYINGTAVDDKVIQIETVEEEDQKISPLPYIILVIALSAILILLYRRFISDPKRPKQETAKPINFKKEALRMLKESEGLYSQKKHKDAYAKASEALRFYHSHRHGDQTELTSVETIALLKKRKAKFKDTQKALNLANMVEFARYRPNRKDFDKIIRLAKDQIE